MANVFRAPSQARVPGADAPASVQGLGPNLLLTLLAATVVAAPFVPAQPAQAAVATPQAADSPSRSLSLYQTQVVQAAPFVPGSAPQLAPSAVTQGAAPQRSLPLYQTAAAPFAASPAPLVVPPPPQQAVGPARTLSLYQTAVAPFTVSPAPQFPAPVPLPGVSAARTLALYQTAVAPFLPGLGAPISPAGPQVMAVADVSAPLYYLAAPVVVLPFAATAGLTLSPPLQTQAGQAPRSLGLYVTAVPPFAPQPAPVIAGAPQVQQQSDSPRSSLSLFAPVAAPFSPQQAVALTIAPSRVETASQRPLALYTAAPRPFAPQQGQNAAQPAPVVSSGPFLAYAAFRATVQPLRRALDWPVIIHALTPTPSGVPAINVNLYRIGPPPPPPGPWTPLPPTSATWQGIGGSLTVAALGAGVVTIDGTSAVQISAGTAATWSPLTASSGAWSGLGGATTVLAGPGGLVFTINGTDAVEVTAGTGGGSWTPLLPASTTWH